MASDGISSPYFFIENRYMDNAERIDNYLKDISAKVGTNFCLIDRVCVLVDADRNRWIIEAPEHSDFVVLFAPLFVIPDSRREQVYEMILKRNVYGNENRGTWIGLHPSTMEVTMCYTHIVESLTSQLFENILTQFVEFSKEMRELLKTEMLKDGDSSSSSSSSGRHSPILPGSQDFSQLA